MVLGKPVAARGLVNGRGPQTKCSGKDGAKRKVFLVPPSTDGTGGREILRCAQDDRVETQEYGEGDSG